MSDWRSTIPDPRAATGLRLALVVSRYNGAITDRLLEGAIEAFRAMGGGDAGFDVFDAPGSFELPALSLAAAQTGQYDAVVALGCLVRGETVHDRVIADAVAKGLMDVALHTGVPAAFGVITAENDEQAAARAGGAKGNKGAEATIAAVQTVLSMRAIEVKSDVAVLGAPARAGR